MGLLPEPNISKPSAEFLRRRQAQHKNRIDWSNLNKPTRAQDNETLATLPDETPLAQHDDAADDALVDDADDDSSDEDDEPLEAAEISEPMLETLESALQLADDDASAASDPPDDGEAPTLTKTRLEGADAEREGSGAVEIVHTCTNGIRVSMTCVVPEVHSQYGYRFNHKASEAVEALISGRGEHCARGLSYDELARWLLGSGRVSRNKLGDYLGRSDEHALATLSAFVDALSFEKLAFDEALRFFLSLFRLPGEAQQIARIMEAFAGAYASQHSGIFRSADTAYVLSYSLIMLNTDAHSDQVVNKMTLEQFISNNRGIDDGEDLPREFLERLYESIRSNEVQIEQREYISGSTKHEGWLHKRGGRVKTWKNRYVIVSGGVLYYFKSPKDREPLGMVPLEGIVVNPVPGPQYFLFDVAPSAADSASARVSNMKSVRAKKGESKTQFEQGRHKVFRFGAASAAERLRWVDAIRLHAVAGLVCDSRGQSEGSASASLRSTDLPS